MSDTQSPAMPSPSKALRIALAVSVALNLAVAGVLAGAYLNHDGPAARAGEVRELGFGLYTEALTREERDQLRKAFLSKRPEFRQARRNMRQDMQNLLAALRAEPFDPVQLQAQLDVQSQRLSQQMVAGQDLMSAFLLQMTPAQRQGFAERLQKGLERGRDVPRP